MTHIYKQGLQNHSNHLSSKAEAVFTALFSIQQLLQQCHLCLSPMDKKTDVHLE